MSLEDCKTGGCEDHFLTRSGAMRAMWAILGVLLAFLGSGVSWAFATGSSLAKAQTHIETSNRDIQELRTKFNSIDSKLEILINVTSENRTILKGKARIQ